MSSPSEMKLIKRDGHHESVRPEKITTRIKKLCKGLDANHVDPAVISERVIAGLYSGITTAELDNLAVEAAASLTDMHPDYSLLATRIAARKLHKETPKLFSEAIKAMYFNLNRTTLLHDPMVSKKTYDTVMKHSDRLNSSIVYSRDFNYTYVGFKALKQSCLVLDERIAERPQQFLMRISIGIHGDNIEDAIQTYDLTSKKHFMHPVTSMRNVASAKGLLTNGYWVQMANDTHSIDAMLNQYATIRKNGGWAGVNIDCVGPQSIFTTLNDVADRIKQRGIESPVAITLQIEIWHPGIYDALNAKQNIGAEERHLLDLFCIVSIPDKFMKRLTKQKVWQLMRPTECSDLADVCGKAFNARYKKYVHEKKIQREDSARLLWRQIMESIQETGYPRLVFKDRCNGKSNQKKMGMIKCLNLADVIQYSSPDEVVVCNSASLALNSFIDSTKMEFDYKKLYEVTKVITRNLNKVIDMNFYPVKKAKKFNLRHRPISIAAHGLIDTFVLLRHPFESKEAADLNRRIFETIYYAAIEASCELAESDGKHKNYYRSQVRKGIFQYDMWNVIPSDRNENALDWDALKARVKEHGLRNSLLVAGTTETSTAEILGSTPFFVPCSDNRLPDFTGRFPVVNSYLMLDLVCLNLWDDDMKARIIEGSGSIEAIDEIPKFLKDLYRSKPDKDTILKMAADRAPYIDQSQSLCIEPAQLCLTDVHRMNYISWALGLKTGLVVNYL